MYCTREAAQNRGVEYTSFVESMGFRKGMACTCSFWHERRGVSAVVHGDDFALLGWKDSLDWFWKEIHKRIERKHIGRIGPAKEDEKQIRILNRIF